MASTEDKIPNREQVKAWFTNRGLEFIGIVDVEQPSAEYLRFKEWVTSHKHANLHYLENHWNIRENPKTLLKSAQRCVVFGINYGFLREESKQEMPLKNAPKIAKYALIRDYHRILKKMGQEIIGDMHRFAGSAHCDSKVFVDSAPILERAYAAQTPSGFIGKNTCFITPKRGSFLLLAEIMTTLPLPIDQSSLVNPKIRDPNRGGCGSCKRCQIHCPTGALDQDYQLDARRCLSYWTIEHRGCIPLEFWPWMGEYFYGCDKCQDVCPYNKKVFLQEIFNGIPLEKISFPNLEVIFHMDQKSYELHFGGTSLVRAKRNGLRRNALIALAVTQEIDKNGILDLALKDEEEIIRKTANQVLEYYRAKGRSVSS